MRSRRLTENQKRRLTETDQAELIANAIGKIIDAADLTSATIQRMLLACLVCEMKNAGRTSLCETFPQERVIAEVNLLDSDEPDDPYRLRPRHPSPKKPM
jgi:hypothetical protein